MPDPEKKENMEQNNGAGTGTNNADQRSEDQKKEQEKKEREEKEKKDQEDKARLEKENNELKFENAFKDIVAQYPHAADFKEQIKARVDQGLPVDEAAVVILNKEKKLVTRQQVDSSAAGGESVGGSGATRIPAGKKDPKDMTTEELRKEFQELEARGEINYTPD